jgi:predicted PurR-regulated permease PerM
LTGNDRWVRITTGVVLAGAAVFLLFRLRFVLVTVVLSAMLAYALLPLVEGFGRVRIGGRPLPRMGAVSAAFALVIVIAVAVVRMAVGPVSGEFAGFADNMSQYESQVVTTVGDARAAVDRSLPQPLRGPLNNAINQAGTLLVNAVTRVLQAAARWLTHIVEIVLIPILAFYFLVDLPALKDELLAFLPSTVRRQTLVAARHADRIVAGYVRGQIILMAISGVVVWTGLAIIGLRFPLLLGIVAGLTRAIPVIGPVIGGIPIVAIALLQSPTSAAAVLVFFVVLQLIESKIILPQVIGHELHLTAATILLALLIGDALFGLTGMFLAAPAAAFVKDLRMLAEQGFAAAPGEGGPSG